MIVGITGKKRAGKDTVAGVMRRSGYQIDSFAAPIRHFVAEMMGWGPDQLDAHKEEPLEFLDGVSARQMMQTVGTEWGRRMVHDELWVRLLVRRLKKTGARNVVIPDVRFDNEAVAIATMGGIVIEVRRPSVESNDGHASEAGISRDLIAETVYNAGTISELERTVEYMMSVNYMRAA